MHPTIPDSLLEEVLRAYDNGTPVAALLAAHPEAREELQRLFATIDEIRATAAAVRPPEQLLRAVLASMPEQQPTPRAWFSWFQGMRVQSMVAACAMIVVAVIATAAAVQQRQTPSVAVIPPSNTAPTNQADVQDLEQTEDSLDAVTPPAAPATNTSGAAHPAPTPAPSISLASVETLAVNLENGLTTWQSDAAALDALADDSSLDALDADLATVTS